MISLGIVNPAVPPNSFAQRPVSGNKQHIMKYDSIAGKTFTSFCRVSKFFSIMSAHGKGDIQRLLIFCYGWKQTRDTADYIRLQYLAEACPSSGSW
jgi:hypothetical protein